MDDGLSQRLKAPLLKKDLPLLCDTMRTTAIAAGCAVFAACVSALGRNASFKLGCNDNHISGQIRKALPEACQIFDMIL